MPDLLLELLSEEIPARMQRRAAEDLRRLVTDALVERGLVYAGAKAFATPRRLALTVHGLPARSPDRREERKGPRVGAPEKAIDGFLRSAGLTSIDQARIEGGKKGDVYVAVIDKAGEPAEHVIADIVPAVVKSFPWPKSMHWGPASAAPGSLSWVRPLHSILCVFGPETEETDVVPFEVGGIRSGRTTIGHRFMAPQPITVRRFDDYVAKLEHAKVVLDADRRKQMILADARDRALAERLDLVEDEGLLEEVAGLVEWPVVLAGGFDEGFLGIPDETIRTTIRANQKCFVLRGYGGLASRFIMVANIEASDGGAAIIAGNERVIHARLADARFFWETDLQTPLAARLPKLDAVIFHDKLGTQRERVARIRRLAGEIAPLVGAEPAMAERAAELAKADLVTEMVGEFPELQGVMGRYYAAAQGEAADVAQAIEDHYKPAGPGDQVPADAVAIAVALADKLDTLVGFWAIDEKPTGSKDPYALRRAALGVTRIVLEKELRLSISNIVRCWYEGVADWAADAKRLVVAANRLVTDRYHRGPLWEIVARGGQCINETAQSWFISKPGIGQLEGLDLNDPRKKEKIDIELRHQEVRAELLDFFADRLKVQLREQGARHDLVDAVFALGDQDDLVLIVRRIAALAKFLDSDDGRNLLVGYRRAANILREEEKKSGEVFTAAVDPRHLVEETEKSLFEAIGAAAGETRAAVTLEDFDDAMAALARLRAPVDAFFENVRVNAPDPTIRANRLRLLNMIRQATLAVADFSKVEGEAR